MGRGSRSGGGRSSFGGGGRSSFGGGRSSRSSFGGPSYSHRGGFGGHRHHHTVYIGPRRHHHYYYGGGVSTSPLSALVIVLIFFTFFFGLIGFGMSGNVAYEEESVQIAIEDYNFYQNMIDDARDEGNIVNGIVVNKYYDYEVEKYYIVYRLPGLSENFETFSVYSLEEVSKYKSGGAIPIALDRSTINFDTESIDLDFENIELEEFSLYVMANSALKSAKTTRTVCLTIAGALLVIVIIVIAKSSKKSSASDTSGVSGSVGSSSASSATCKYCGTVHEPGTKKCSNCGAQLR